MLGSAASCVHPAPTEQFLPDATQLAVERTRLAHERTLMAWVRTSVSLISFGFTIYKFFEYLRENQQTATVASALNPRRFGMVMISLGLFMLVVATIQHRASLKQLAERYGKGPSSLAMVVAVLVGAIGVLAFVGALFRQ
jgi:putative membrane protein